MKRFFAVIITIILSSSVFSYGQEAGEDDFTMLTAYRDFQSQATDFSLTFLRYRPRGIENRLRSLTWNTVSLQDWENGTISWNITGNLSSLNLLQRSDTILTVPGVLSHVGKIGASISNRSYRYKASASYNYVASPGFVSTIDVYRKWGESLSIDGISADSYSFLYSTQILLRERNILEINLLYAPSQRTTQRASTAEAYKLTVNNLYNPAWGWQGSSKRSVRENKAKQPIAIVAYKAKLKNGLDLNTSVSARMGSEYRTGLSWQNTPNPYPDYYRYMPSYQSDTEVKKMISDAWLNDPSIRQIDFQNIYNINGHNSPQAKYIIEERWRDVRQFQISSSITGGKLAGGFDITYAKNRNYKRIGDLMGAEYWLDIDAFVENDDDVKDQVQNNLRNPNSHAKAGDVFGYDYTMSMKKAEGWASWGNRWGNFSSFFKGMLTAFEYQRTGHFEKENFSGDASYGKSPRIFNYDYNLTAEAWYHEGGKFRGGGKLDYRELSPNPSGLFISREYRNATVPESIKEKIVTAELNADYRTPGFTAKGAIYYTTISDKTQLLNFYDDNIHQYTHYWLQGISERNFGLEFSTEFGVAENLTASIAIMLSDNRYTSNPKATQWRESTGAELRTAETVYYDNMHISGSPQNAGVFAINYSPKTYRFSLTANCFENNYISITPLRRTERSSSQITKTPQEKLTGGATLDLFGGRTFFFKNNKSMGIWLGLNNILNNQGIRSGGYESFRTVNSSASDSRYYYALGINGFVSVSFTF